MNQIDSLLVFVVVIFSFVPITILVCYLFFLFTKKKDGENKSIGCITPLIISLLLSILLGVIISLGTGSSTNSGENRRSSDTVTCPVCDRRFQKGSKNARSINWTGMCENCYDNYNYAQNALKERTIN